MISRGTESIESYRRLREQMQDNSAKYTVCGSVWCAVCVYSQRPGEERGVGRARGAGRAAVEGRRARAAAPPPPAPRTNLTIAPRHRHSPPADTTSL